MNVDDILRAGRPLPERTADHGPEDCCYLCDLPLTRTTRVDEAHEITYCEHCDRTKGCAPGCALCRKVLIPPHQLLKEYPRHV